MTCLIEFFDNIKLGYSVVIDDDDDNDKVAYAYLQKNNNFIGDVWLYNSVLTPDKTNWRDKEAMPFLNPKEYVSETEIPRISNVEDVYLKWYFNEKEDELEKVEIWLAKNDLLLAVMKPGSKPGWSYLAKKKNPLAIPFKELTGDDFREQ